MEVVGGVRNLCLMGAELQFEVMKKFWGCWRWMDAGDDTIILKENRKKTNNPKQLQGFAQNTARILQMVGQRKAWRGGGTKEREEAGNGRGREGPREEGVGADGAQGPSRVPLKPSRGRRPASRDQIFCGDGGSPVLAGETSRCCCSSGARTGTTDPVAYVTGLCFLGVEAGALDPGSAPSGASPRLADRRVLSASPHHLPSLSVS